MIVGVDNSKKMGDPNKYIINHPIRGNFYVINETEQIIEAVLDELKAAFPSFSFRTYNMQDKQFFENDVHQNDFSADDCVFIILILKSNCYQGHEYNYTSVLGKSQSSTLRGKPKLVFIFKESSIEFDSCSRDEHPDDVMVIEFKTAGSEGTKEMLRDFVDVFKSIESEEPITIEELLTKLEEKNITFKQDDKLKKALCFGR